MILWLLFNKKMILKYLFKDGEVKNTSEMGLEPTTLRLEV